MNWLTDRQRLKSTISVYIWNFLRKRIILATHCVFIEVDFIWNIWHYVNAVDSTRFFCSRWTKFVSQSGPKIERFTNSATKFPHGKCIYTFRNNSSGIVFCVTMSCVANFRWWLNSFVAHIYSIHIYRTHSLYKTHIQTQHTGIDAQMILIYVKLKTEANSIIIKCTIVQSPSNSN